MVGVQQPQDAQWQATVVDIMWIRDGDERMRHHTMMKADKTVVAYLRKSWFFFFFLCGMHH